MTTDDKVNELLDASNYEGTELAETWAALCELWNRNDCLTDKFQANLVKEIDIQYEIFLEEFEWKDVEQSIVVRKSRDLVRRDEY